MKETKEMIVKDAVPCPYCGGRLLARPKPSCDDHFQTHGGRKAYHACCYDAARLTLFTQPHRPNMPKCFPTTEKLVKHWNKLLVKAARYLNATSEITIEEARELGIRA